MINLERGLITEIRNICNYVITGIIAFVGFTISSAEKPIDTSLRKIIFYGLLTLIFCFWTAVNFFEVVNVGFEPKSIDDLLDKSTSEYKTTKENSKEKVFHHILASISNQYNSAQKVLDRKNKIFYYFLITALIFFIVTIIFFNFKTISINIDF